MWAKVLTIPVRPIAEQADLAMKDRLFRGIFFLDFMERHPRGYFWIRYSGLVVMR
tara:strand:+ start:361 stop:525 length:165 start_codon:yes stop_codon:yes gene_type:complete